MDSTATAPATCEIARLPDDLLSASLARTGPLDACRAAAVSPAFRAAADADAVWDSLLPRDLPPLADGELPDDPHSTKKQLFMRLSDAARPVLLADGLTVRDLDPPLVCLSVSIHPSADVITHPRLSCVVWCPAQSMWLDRATAAKCYMLSARKLCIIWGGTPQYWRWIPLTDSRSVKSKSFSLFIHLYIGSSVLVFIQVSSCAFVGC